jgi:GGDEF domain-containing protein
MSAQERLYTATWNERVAALQEALGAAQDAYRLMSASWHWFRQHTGADVLGLATLGPPAPVGYLFAEGPFDSGTREGLWQRLVGMAREVRPQPGMYPRRAGDRRAWHASGPLPTLFDTPITLGPWTIRAAGKPAAVVIAWQAIPELVDPVVDAALPDACALVALYLRNLQWMDIEPEAEPPPTDPVTFEEVLELEVTRARRKRVSVSLALIEHRLRGRDLLDGAVPPELRDDVERVMRATVRKGDRVVPIGDTCTAVVMPKTDARNALVAADRFRTALYQEFAEREPRLAVRIGIGGRDPEDSEASDLLARASNALAEARNAHCEAAFLHV